MKTLLMVLSHKGCEERVFRHYPYWKVSGFDVVGVGTIGGEHRWPPGMSFTHCCTPEDGYVKVGYQPLQLLNTLELFLDTPEWNRYSHVMITHEDSVFIYQVPEKPIIFFATIAGDCPKSWKVKPKRFLHVPWWMNRAVARKILDYGNALFESEQFENGSEDVWIARIVEDLAIEVQNGGTWSCNGDDMKVRMAEARNAIRKGCWFIHGIQTEEQLNKIMFLET